MESSSLQPDQCHVVLLQQIPVGEYSRAPHCSAAAPDTETNNVGKEETSPGTRCDQCQGFTCSLPLPAAHSARHSAGEPLAFSHQFRCADSHSPFHSHQDPAATLFTSAASTEFFTPPYPAQLRERNIIEDQTSHS